MVDRLSIKQSPVPQAALSAQGGAARQPVVAGPSLEAMKSVHAISPRGLTTEEMNSVARPKRTAVLIYGDEVSFLGAEEGEVDTSHGAGIPLPFGEDVPERYRQVVLAAHGGRGELAWARLQATSREMLQSLPENPFVQQQAWLCGLHKDGGPHVALMRERQLREIEEEAQSQRIRAQVPTWFIQS